MPAFHRNGAGERAPPELAVGGRVTAHRTAEDGHPASDR